MILQFPSPDRSTLHAPGGGWSPEALESFAIMPVASLADYYFSEIDISPRGLQARQLEEIIERRGLTYSELRDTWMRAQAG